MSRIRGGRGAAADCGRAWTPSTRGSRGPLGTREGGAPTPLPRLRYSPDHPPRARRGSEHGVGRGWRLTRGFPASPCLSPRRAPGAAPSKFLFLLRPGATLSGRRLCVEPRPQSPATSAVSLTSPPPSPTAPAPPLRHTALGFLSPRHTPRVGARLGLFPAEPLRVRPPTRALRAPGLLRAGGGGPPLCRPGRRLRRAEGPRPPRTRAARASTSPSRPLPPPSLPPFLPPPPLLLPPPLERESVPLH